MDLLPLILGMGLAYSRRFFVKMNGADGFACGVLAGALSIAIIMSI